MHRVAEKSVSDRDGEATQKVPQRPDRLLNAGEHNKCPPSLA